jgi:hypothetical protein
LVEAIEHIRMSQRCDLVQALRQLKREMRDGMVRAQWEDSEEPKDRPDPEHLETSQLLLIGTGFAPDNVLGIYRPLLIERSAVQTLWPLSDQRREESHWTASQPTQQQTASDKSSKGTLGRPTNRDVVWNTLSQMRDQEYSLNQAQKALAAEIAKRNSKQIGAKGWSERVVVKHVSDWLKENEFSPTRKTRLQK